MCDQCSRAAMGQAFPAPITFGAAKIVFIPEQSISWTLGFPCDSAPIDANPSQQDTPAWMLPVRHLVSQRGSGSICWESLLSSPVSFSAEVAPI